MKANDSLGMTRRSGTMSIWLGILLALLAAGLSILALRPAAASGLVVDSTGDATVSGDGACTLREAITNANLDDDTTSGDCAPGFGADVIGFAPAIGGQTITLAGTELTISSTMTINGLGASQLAISAGDASRVFDVTGGVVEIAGLTIRDGRVTDANGGGVRNAGTLILRNAVVVSNTIASGGTTDGGGIYNSGTLTVTHSAIIRNTTLGSNGRGGGVASAGGSVYVANSTISGNSANSWGGGVLNTGAGVMKIVNATVVENTAISFLGGGLYTENTATLKSSILANNVDSDGANDCYHFGPAPVSEGYNLVEHPGTCSFGATGDFTGQDPDLGSLADNGDPATDWGQATWTHTPLPGSPAIDRIPEGTNGCGVVIATDQRGYLRIGACDVGALETQGIKVALKKFVSDDTPAPGQTITYTLVAAVAQSGGVSVTHASMSDTLPVGINFVGPVTLVGGGSGTTAAPPTLVSGLTITGGTSITVTFPVTVSIGLAGGTVLTNTAAVSSSEVIVPVTGSRALTVTNVAPLANDDAPAVLEDSPTTGLDVLANDDDLNGDALSITAVGPSNHGGTAAENGGMIDYAPAQDFYGTEVLTYTASDGSLTATAAVTVTVIPVNDPPVIGAGEGVGVTMSEDGAPVAFSLTLGARDVEDDPLAWSVLSPPAHGWAEVAPIAALSATVAYTPTADYNGEDAFTVQVSDGELTDTVAVDVTVEPTGDPPVAADDYVVAVGADIGRAILLDVLSNDVEPDGEALSIGAVGAPVNGGVTISNGQHLLYTPAITGTESFTYTITDGGLFDTASVHATTVEGEVSGGDGETVVLPGLGLSDTITITLEIPADAVSAGEHFALVFGEAAPPTDPPRGYKFAGLAFRLEAYVNGVETSPFTFATPLTLTVEYDETDVAHIGMGDDELALFFQDAGQWSSDGVTVFERDTLSNRLVFTVERLTQFALFGWDAFTIYLPAVVNRVP